MGKIVFSSSFGNEDTLEHNYFIEKATIEELVNFIVSIGIFNIKLLKELTSETDAIIQQYKEVLHSLLCMEEDSKEKAQELLDKLLTHTVFVDDEAFKRAYNLSESEEIER